jgi:membrane fusion protein (multidrug efflux system)
LEQLMLQDRRSVAARAEEAQPEAERDATTPAPEAPRRPSLKAVETESRARPAASPEQTPSPTPPAEEKIADAELASTPPKRRLRNAVLTVGALALLAAGAWYGHYWWVAGRFIVSTDDAYVGAKTATLAAKVPGYVQSVAVEDNAHVRAGDPMIRIDDGDYQLAVQTAKDNIATEQATIDRIGKQIAAQAAAVDQAKAELASAQAGQTRAELELTRQQALAAKDYASLQALEQAQAARDQAVASVAGAKAGVDAAKTNADVLKAQQNEAAQTLKQLQTALARAERDLSFTVIRAPFDGVMGNRAVEAGDYVQGGQRLANLVPLGAVYIDANFKETQLDRLEPGQKAELFVDALPDRTIAGTVMSVAPASGSVFSLLPPDNATGNFTKIVQRVPVRIEVPVTVAEQELLRPGMSVVVSVNTKAQPNEATASAAPATDTAAR